VAEFTDVSSLASPATRTEKQNNFYLKNYKNAQQTVFEETRAALAA
jgi:hypothetical protein